MDEKYTRISIAQLPIHRKSSRGSVFWSNDLHSWNSNFYRCSLIVDLSRKVKAERLLTKICSVQQRKGHKDAEAAVSFSYENNSPILYRNSTPVLLRYPSLRNESTYFKQVVFNCSCWRQRHLTLVTWINLQEKCN